MAKINLLPWREELRKQKKKNFFIAMVASAVATLLVFVLVHMYIQGMQEYQEKRNTILTEEIKTLDIKLGEIRTIEETRNKLLEKIKVIQRLQESRPEAVHLFDEIPRKSPEGVFLTKFIQSGQNLSFDGKSQSNARVSAFMRAIDASEWLHTPVLIEIKSPDGIKTILSDFQMKASLGKEKDDDANKTKAK